MAEYLAHVTWSTIVAYREELRKAAVGKASERLPLTDQYGSDQPLLDKLRYGDGLWLFTAPVLGRGKGRRTHFQAIRTLTDESAENLARLHSHVAARRTIFLSHKHDEAGSLVREVSECLRDDALCWWDVQALPQSRLYTDSLLQEMLRDGIRQAGWFLAFLTPCYARDGWTDKEYQEALAFCRSLSKGPMIVPVLLGGGLREGMDEQFAIDGGAGARAIADAILARFASTHM